MPRPRFERADAGKRELLLDAASEEFAAHGYTDASINRILAAAGFSKGSFYYYFDDKADLAAAVVHHEATRYLDHLRAVAMPETPRAFWGALENLVASTEAFRRERPGAMDALSRLGTAAARDPVLLERMTSTSLRETNAIAYELWRRGQKVGAVRDDLTAEQIAGLVLALKIALTSTLLPTERAPTRRELDAFMRIHVDMIRRLAERRTRPAVSKGRSK